MEIWTRRRDQLGWTPWPSVPLGLATLLDTPDAQVLLLTERPETDHDVLVATLRLVHAVIKAGGLVVLASPHPAVSWVGELLPFGVDQVWVVERQRRPHHPALRGVSEIDGGICPFLRTTSEGDVTLSTCGRHHGRHVLARHHLDSWCLHDRSSCPFASAGPDELEHSASHG